MQLTTGGGRGRRAVVARGASAQVHAGRIHARLTTTEPIAHSTVQFAPGKESPGGIDVGGCAGD